MKVFAGEETIVSLENVRRIDKDVCSLGKRDEDNIIRIIYTDDNDEILRYGKNKEMRDREFVRIGSILRE